jgi:hypothetical protein
MLAGRTVHRDGHALISDDNVDAVLVCSWGPTHEEFVLAAIAANKPVFCEKPLAATEQACRTIIDAEVAAGRRLVQVGFMRRYDAAYQALKKTVDGGAVGAPLIYYSGHRNAAVPDTYTKDMAIVDTAVHDFDVARWLLGEELTSIQVLAAKPNSLGGGLQDPLLMILRTESGVLVNVETSVNIRYGYDIRGELVGETGTAALADGGPVLLRSRRCPASSPTSAIPKSSCRRARTSRRSSCSRAPIRRCCGRIWPSTDVERRAEGLAAVARIDRSALLALADPIAARGEVTVEVAPEPRTVMTVLESPIGRQCLTEVVVPTAAVIVAGSEGWGCVLGWDAETALRADGDVRWH